MWDCWREGVSLNEIGDDPDPETVFLKLRELRNSW